MFSSASTPRVASAAAPSGSLLRLRALSLLLMLPVVTPLPPSVVCPRRAGARWRMATEPPEHAPVASHRPVVFCGPSGVGKGTIINSLMTTFPDSFAFAVSHTTREPRAGEVDGREYFFTSKPVMEAAIQAGEFLEHARVHGNLYGTSKSAIEKISASGRVCLLDLDVQGVRTLQARQNELALHPHFVFIAPPSVDDLTLRLHQRNTETTEQIEKRVSAAADEIAWGTKPGNLDLVLVNKDLQQTVQLAEQAMASFFPHLRRPGSAQPSDVDIRRELNRIAAISAATAAATM